MFARVFRPLLLLVFTVLAGCTILPTPQEIDVQPLVHDGKVRKGMKRAVVVVPGALASVGIYEPVLDWNVPDGAVMAYRFPGLDGLDVNHRVDIAEAGDLIARALTRLGVEEVYLIGFSTGGPVALEAASRLKTQTVSVALISTAGPFPAGVKASIDGFFDVVKAMVRAQGRGMEEAWLENYRTLLYGRKHFDKGDQARQSKALAERQRGALRTPTTRITMAHTADLMTWNLPSGVDYGETRIGVFHGAEDTVFPIAATRRFAAQIPADRIVLYPGQGHLLFVTAPTLWEDVRAFFGLPAQH